jgi:hypothetical protein
MYDTVDSMVGCVKMSRNICGPESRSDPGDYLIWTNTLRYDIGEVFREGVQTLADRDRFVVPNRRARAGVELKGTWFPKQEAAVRGSLKPVQ